MRFTNLKIPILIYVQEYQLSPERIIFIRQVDSLNVTSSQVGQSLKKKIIIHELYILYENI